MAPVTRSTTTANTTTTLRRGPPRAAKKTTRYTAGGGTNDPGDNDYDPATERRARKLSKRRAATRPQQAPSPSPKAPSFSPITPRESPVPEVILSSRNDIPPLVARRIRLVLNRGLAAYMIAQAPTNSAVLWYAQSP